MSTISTPSNTGNRDRKNESEPRADELASNVSGARDGVGKSEGECAAFTLAVDCVVREEHRKEREHHLHDECKVDKPEDGEDRIVRVNAVRETDACEAAHVREPSDVVLQSGDEHLHRVRVAEDRVAHAAP